jgi:dTDP-glucose 4,6-dehydratase
MRVLVTGGCGFIGTNFIKFLLRKHPNMQILNFDKLAFGSARGSLRDAAKDERYTFVRGDIANQKLIASLIEDVDAIVNFAAESHVDRSISGPRAFIRTNTVGVFSLLEAVRKSGKSGLRLLHIGTDEEYGDIQCGSFKEEDRLGPSSPYAASKAAASMLIQAYQRTYGLRAILTRCTNNYGPYQFPEKLIPKTIIRANLGLKVPLYGDGRNIRDWTHVEDHCEAVDAVLKNGQAGEVYNISSGNELANLEVVGAILEMLHRPSSLVEYVEDRPGHDFRYSIDSSKIRSQFGWKPRRAFRQSLEETVNWYLSNEAWWRPLAGKKVLHPTPWKLRW